MDDDAKPPPVLVCTPEDFDAIAALLHISDLPSPITLKRLRLLVQPPPTESE